MLPAIDELRPLFAGHSVCLQRLNRCLAPRQGLSISRLLNDSQESWLLGTACSAIELIIIAAGCAPGSFVDPVLYDTPFKGQAAVDKL